MDGFQLVTRKNSKQRNGRKKQKKVLNNKINLENDVETAIDIEKCIKKLQDSKFVFLSL